ncbi:MAG: hypothetical protein AAF745_05100, partial [Planctomycetota bacterium]
DRDEPSDEIQPRETTSHSARLVSHRNDSGNPLEQLNHLHEEVARQSHWLRRRRELKDQDTQLKKLQAGHVRALERAEQQRRGLWAKCGVATAEQFYQQVDAKSRLVMMRDQYEELDKKIRSMIGSTVEYNDVEREIEGAKATDLERRWEALTTRMGETEQRIATLQTAQGELAQSMKQLGGDDRLMTTKLELGCIERQLESVARRWQTLATASCLLEDVCGTFERERQPETLREASSFLNQLTDGKYVRIWTPLGTNQLKIDDAEGTSLPLEVLSRGTGEAVFIALRLSLAAAYARRGVMLPLVLDDVLVNFDGQRAIAAARTLKTFAELGHQVLMFTCHEHIVEIFHEIDVQVRQMPPQGEPGRAFILEPEMVDEVTYDEPEPEVAEEWEPEVEAVTEPEPEPVVIVEPEVPEPVELVIEHAESSPQPSPYRFRTMRRHYRRRRAPELTVRQPIVPPRRPKPKPAPVIQAPIPVAVPDASIEWAWFQREPADGQIDEDEAAAAAVAQKDWGLEIESSLQDDQESEQRDHEPVDAGSWWLNAS